MPVKSTTRYVEPVKYTVGLDITQAQYDEALLKIADWFVEFRKTKEPALAAKQILQECLDGVTKDGHKWFSAATASLVQRVRMKCRFDLDTMKPLRTGTEKTKVKKAAEREREAKKRATASKDGLIPEEIAKDLARSIKYGDDPSVLLSSAEQRRWNGLRDSYCKQHPELDTVSAEAELQLLCDLHVLADRHRLKLLLGQHIDPKDRLAVIDSLSKLKHGLGIHPDQIVKKAKSKEDVSIGAAALRLEALPNYRELRERFWIEELLQLYQMYMQPSADGLTYQLDEVGLFGLTRSKPSACPKCGTRVFAGLSIDEIEAWLIKKGALIPIEGMIVPIVGTDEST